MAISYLNGVWQPVEEARVSVLDRGFLFGDGVYEVIPVYGGKPFTLDRHIKRFDQSMSEVMLKNPLPDAEWEALLLEAVKRSEESNATIYVQVTRGADTKRDHVYPKEPRPTIFIMVSPAPGLARQEIKPYAMITMEDFRWQKGHIKSTSLIAAGLVKNGAKAQGVDDALMLRDGKLTEASASNVFIVKDGTVITPPKSSLLLHGITRDVVVEELQKSDIPVEEREITEAELEDADEIFITSSTHETWPVGTLNGKTIGNGEGGVVWQEVDKIFQAFKASIGCVAS